MSAKQAESLIRRADPLAPSAAAPDLSPRATRELSVLYDGSGSATAVVAPPRRRRVGLIAVAACGAAVVVAAAAVFAVNATTGDSDGGLVADEPVYGAAQELEGAADLIVRAELGKGAERTVDDVTSIQAPAKVLATAKGTAPGPQVTVSYTPPDAGGPESAALTPGKEYVFLLERQDDGRFTLVNSTQGAYGVGGGRAVAGESNAVMLSPGVLKALRLTG
ncbi:hypothetical protein EAO72_24465 [Streptomyces sp. or43]|nr:hypothetical protein EAO72_24465 [Streptomyces sp. or43]